MKRYFNVCIISTTLFKYLISFHAKIRAKYKDLFITREKNPLLYDKVNEVLSKILTSNKDIERLSKINWSLNIIKDDSVVNANVFEVSFFFAKNYLKFVI